MLVLLLHINKKDLVFTKVKYHSGADPTKDPHLDIVLNDEKSKLLCNWHYANELNNIKQKYKLNY